MIENGMNGLIVKSESVSELSEAIQYIMITDIRKTACRALEKARDYTIEKMALEHMNIFEKVVDSL